MTEPPATRELAQGVKDAQAKFDAGLGADGDASPYPMLAELRAKAPVHPGWPEMSVFENPADGQQIFSAYTFDAVKAVFTDNKTFSTRRYAAIVRPLVERTVDRLRDTKRADLVEEVFMPIPVRVIAALIGASA